ncbi:CocE/NonD family hydrolase [Fimbriimonas ginsengisoli]|uniref:Glutaryl-7-ACA acylase n=1 Tax=Fimbriimonas ginsengisoli Gsoil 348 TaxID=661478 RepID=A0A068NVT9_FIMGI|nr:CocE/NonD family hydrolase [Fimbriimonas ginsengisoli]AIE85719.1 Glutaryl-7-ACA acylase [Fimbriimonas ginsengisoli Gsoil 348]
MAIPTFLALLLIRAQTPVQYAKFEFNIPMRDGVKLYTSVYIPKQVAGRHPILLERTPYSAGPYGPANKDDFLGSPRMRQKGYIFAYQDVRGQYMSGGTYENVRPIRKDATVGTDESTDTWDTVDYLVKHVPGNNGAVGLWGISYPGFYAAAGAIDTHPALKAVSPQAPVSDWFVGDDVHHNGAFFLQDNFDFGAWFDMPHKSLERDHPGLKIDRGGRSAYDFFLQGGSLAEIEKKYFKGRIPYWNEVARHGTYDDYWKDRALPPHMKNVKCAVLTVGGLFDAEDMWGALNTYAATERQNPGIPNFLVMGPWYHGMWAEGEGTAFGDLSYGMATSQWYRENVEFPFFERYLRGQEVPPPAEATIFQTGANRWRTFTQWPPAGLGKYSVYLGEGHTLTESAPGTEGADSYENDPARPTPYIADLSSKERPATYMVDDQRWAEKRSDVATYKGPVLARDLTVAGPVDVDLWASTTGTDADFVVKVIDVWPADSTDVSSRGRPMAGYEQLLRGDIMRGKFRNSLEKPEPFVPGQSTRVHFRMNDVLHTFKAGHRIMVQVQSSWFPLVDRNPNRFMDIYQATTSDFQPATITLHHDPAHPSSVSFGTL